MDNTPRFSGGGDDCELMQQKQEWAKTQDMLKSKLILEDDFGWNLPSMGSNSDQSNANNKGNLKYIGGVDISFSKEDPSTACAALVVLDAGTLEVVHEEFDVVRLQVPYIPGFLAFREAPILLGLLEKMKTNNQHFYPQVLMVDGNGLLHPRGFGLACHLGVLADLPTIGVGKNLHHVDGLNQSELRRQLEAKENCNKELILLTGQSGTTWGAAMRSCPGLSKPIYISVGHRISLDSAIGIVKFCSNYRIPEPIRQKSIQQWVAINSEMAATFSSVMWKILVIAVAIAALLIPSGEGRFVCRGKCEDIRDCDNWCKTAGGYPQGGQCVPPLYQFCCCIE
uniref:Endonuclease V n=1 Tax=Oryza barthii TaxID=65489 RepID=A0A0D3GJM0_9ORYZ